MEGEVITRNRDQRGSIKKEKDRWKIRWHEPVMQPDGTTRKVYRQAFLSFKNYPTKTLAERRLAEIVAPFNKDDFRPTLDISFSAFAAKWKKDFMRHYEASTQETCTSILNAHLVPYFGEMLLKSITFEAVQRFVNDSKVGPKTVRNHVKVLMAMWTSAQACGHVTHNPFPRSAAGKPLLRMPKLVKAKVYAFTPDEAVLVYSRMPRKWQLLVQVATLSGLRPGELAGLQRESLKGSELWVSQSVYRGLIKPPKTENGVRRVPIAMELARAIEEHLEATVGDFNPHGLMWTLPNVRRGLPAGRPLNLNYFQEHVLAPLLKELGIREKLDALGIRGCGLYAFRHMRATMFDALNVPLKTRQEQMGHSDVSITIGTYTKPTDEAGVRVARQSYDLLYGKGVVQ